MILKRAGFEDASVVPREEDEEESDMTFIELTVAEGSPSKRVLINVAQIASVRARILEHEDLGIQVELANGHYIDCRESFQAVRELFDRSGVEMIR